MSIIASKFVDGDIQKALDKSKLVKKKVNQRTKTGKVVQVNKWVKPDKDTQKEPLSYSPPKDPNAWKKHLPKDFAPPTKEQREANVRRVEKEAVKGFIWQEKRIIRYSK